MRVLVATAIYPTRENPARGAFVQTQIESLKQAGVEVELFLVQARLPIFKYPKSLFELPKRLANGTIDLIHAHYSYPGAIARTQLQVPVVLTFHGSDVMGNADARGRATLVSRLIASGGKLLSRVVDAVIVQSEQMARQLKGVKAHIIPCEVDLEVFHPIERELARRDLGLSLDKRYILFPANPRIEGKNFPLARTTVDQLSARDPLVELLIVYRETQERLAIYLNACDALIFPSFQEGSPVVVKQAMACNLPIVSTDVGDVRQLIGTTQGCFVCGPSVPEFAAGLAEILRRQERTRGRENVRHLAPPAVAHRIIQVYEEVLEMRRRRIGRSSQAISR
jgi:teichuronic acid biosynthesis glycosyltransferase TuaC